MNVSLQRSVPIYSRRRAAVGQPSGYILVAEVQDEEHHVHRADEEASALRMRLVDEEQMLADEERSPRFLIHLLHISWPLFLRLLDTSFPFSFLFADLLRASLPNSSDQISNQRRSVCESGCAVSIATTAITIHNPARYGDGPARRGARRRRTRNDEPSVPV